LDALKGTTGCRAVTSSGASDSVSLVKRSSPLTTLVVRSSSPQPAATRRHAISSTPAAIIRLLARRLLFDQISFGSGCRE
jgi:hypothetical protein